MLIKERVRGILITDRNTLLLIRRVRPGRDPYWVFPGGGTEESDATLEAALEREVSEEMAASVIIRSLVYVQERDEADIKTREYFFLCHVAKYDFDSKTGAEFDDSSRGEYVLEEVGLTIPDISSLNIQPPELKTLLLENHSRLLAMPDLRNVN